MFESFRQEPLKLVRKTNRGIPEVNHRDVKYLQERVGDLKLDALILDPVSTLHIGMNENDNADMDFFIRNGVIVFVENDALHTPCSYLQRLTI